MSPMRLLTILVSAHLKVLGDRRSEDWCVKHLEPTREGGDGSHSSFCLPGGLGAFILQLPLFVCVVCLCQMPALSASTQKAATFFRSICWRLRNGTLFCCRGAPEASAFTPTDLSLLTSAARYPAFHLPTRQKPLPSMDPHISTMGRGLTFRNVAPRRNEGFTSR